MTTHVSNWRESFIQLTLGCVFKFSIERDCAIALNFRPSSSWVPSESLFWSIFIWILPPSIQNRILITISKAPQNCISSYIFNNILKLLLFNERERCRETGSNRLGYSQATNVTFLIHTMPLIVALRISIYKAPRHMLRRLLSSNNDFLFRKRYYRDWYNGQLLFGRSQ